MALVIINWGHILFKDNNLNVWLENRDPKLDGVRMKINSNPLRVLKPYRILHINFYIERKLLLQYRGVSMANRVIFLTKYLQKFLTIPKKIYQMLEYYRLTIWSELSHWQLTPRDQ